MPTSTINAYNHTPVQLNQGVDLINDTIVVLLTTSAHVPAAADAVEADIDNEVAGNGYARQTLANKSWSTVNTDDARFDFDNPVFTASGGDIVARHWHILDTTTDTLLAWGLLDQADADVTVTDGNTLTLNINASGLFEVQAP